MARKDKIYKLQDKLLNEIEEERKTIEDNFKFLQGKIKQPPLPRKKRRRRPIRARRILLLRKFRKFLKRIEGRITKPAPPPTPPASSL
jgi:hypothetical protein